MLIVGENLNTEIHYFHLLIASLMGMNYCYYMYTVFAVKRNVLFNESVPFSGNVVEGLYTDCLIFSPAEDVARDAAGEVIKRNITSSKSD